MGRLLEALCGQVSPAATGLWLTGQHVCAQVHRLRRACDRDRFSLWSARPVAGELYISLWKSWSRQQSGLLGSRGHPSLHVQPPQERLG